MFKGLSTTYLRIAAAVSIMMLASGQAHAANKMTQLICQLKNYLFDGAFIGALIGLAITGALVYFLMDDDSKIKGKLLTIIGVGFIISAIPEIMSALGWASC